MPLTNLAGREKTSCMPRLAANLGLLFAEQPLLARFGAAAAAGFGAVELLYPTSRPQERCGPSLRVMA